MSDTSTREDRIASGCLQVLGFGIFALIMLFTALPDRDGGGSGARSSGITWETYDVTIDVREDGSIHVTEYQEVEFDGTYTAGFAEIPMDRIESIDNVTVSIERGVIPEEGSTDHLYGEEPQGEMVQAREVDWIEFDDDPNTFRARQEGGLYLIDYAFDPTSAWQFGTVNVNNTRTIIVEYDAHGVIRDYPEAAEPWQQVHWLAISDEVTAIAPIESASLTLNLPADVAKEDLVVAPEAGSKTANQVTWTRGAMDEDDSFDVQAAFPAITDATSPSWQEAADARDASIEDREQRRNAGQLMLVLAGIAILVIGSLTMLYAWYRGIREPNIGPVHQEITDLPREMPAVLVGSLLDEEVHPRDIAAGVLDLDRQGLVTIRNGTESETENYYLTLNRPIPFRPAWTRQMLTTIFGDDARDGTTKGFSALRDLFGVHRHELQRAIDQTLVDDGYYEELPETSRKHWTWVTYGFAIASVIAAIAILSWVRGWTSWSIIPLIPGFALWWFGRKLTPHVAQKTQKGAETASMWRAFERHLVSTRNMMSAGTQASRQAEYGPWLTAFGIQSGWLSEMNRPAWDASRAPRQAGSSVSTWIWGDDATSHRESLTPTTPSSGSASDPDRPTLQPPAWRPIGGGWDAGRWGDMQSASNSVSSSLSSMSDGAFSMIGDMLESIGSSSGGGGGRSSGGSSFRGSSSRSGGGRSRSSSGGGRRGFR